MMRNILIGASAVFALAACEMQEEVITRAEADMQADQIVAPANPDDISGPVEPANSLNGSFNLRASECGTVGSEGALTIQGRNFDFAANQCTATSSENRGNTTEVNLSCSATENRLVQLGLAPGSLRLQEGSQILTYYRCPSA